MIASVGIPSANALPVSQGALQLPNMSMTVRGWFRPMVLTRVLKSVDSFEIVENRIEISCYGVIQPFGARELKIKPEGQRSWGWKMLHTTPEVQLKNDEEFTYQGTRYRVMSQQNFRDYGYITYELVQDYKANFE
jgi:hypothetical protein